MRSPRAVWVADAVAGGTLRHEQSMHHVPGKLGSTTKVASVLACKSPQVRDCEPWKVQTASTNACLSPSCASELLLFSGVVSDFFFLIPSHSLGY